MNKTEKKKILYFFREEGIRVGLLLIYFAVMTITEIVVDFSWMKDVNIWLNTILLQIILFNGMMVFTRKIKNKYFRECISISIALFLGETIKYNFYKLNLFWLNIVFCIILLILQLLLWYNGYWYGIGLGVNKSLEKIDQSKKEYLRMSKMQQLRIKSAVKKAIKFEKENRLAAQLLREVESVESLIEFKDELEKLEEKKIKK